MQSLLQSICVHKSRDDSGMDRRRGGIEHGITKRAAPDLDAPRALWRRRSVTREQVAVSRGVAHPRVGRIVRLKNTTLIVVCGS